MLTSSIPITTFQGYFQLVVADGSDVDLRPDAGRLANMRIVVRPSIRVAHWRGANPQTLFLTDMEFWTDGNGFVEFQVVSDQATAEWEELTYSLECHLPGRIEVVPRWAAPANQVVDISTMWVA